MKKTIKKSYLFIAIITVMIMLLSSLVVGIFISPNNAYALSDTSSAVKAGNGAELWDADKGVFNNTVIDDLTSKLFGNENPVEYIKKFQDTQTGAYVVPASIINNKVGNVANGMVVTLDSKEWMVASLTLADIDGKNDNVIVTLYLADNLGASSFYNNGSTSKGNNAYSRSMIIF